MPCRHSQHAAALAHNANTLFQKPQNNVHISYTSFKYKWGDTATSKGFLQSMSARSVQLNHFCDATARVEHVKSRTTCVSQLFHSVSGGGHAR